MGLFDHREGVALVTGGSGGLGQAICAALAREGSDVAFTYRSNAAAAAETSSLVEVAGRTSLAVQLSVDDAGAVQAFVDDALARFGKIHTVVSAAGPYVPMIHFSKVGAAQFARQMQEDSVGFFHLVHATLPALRASSGALVALTTVANRRFPVRDVMSSAPKAAVEAIVRAVAAEEGRFGVRANCVGAGLMGDGLMRTLIERGELRQQDLDHALGQIPLKRFGSAADIAEAVVFLASDRARYITGQYLDVDGGYSV